jgi:hypothetical protein
MLGPDIVSLVKTRIKELAQQEELLVLDRKMKKKKKKKKKKKFDDHFPKDIPHVNKLPMDVYHHIKLKLGAAVRTAHAYTCPCKYRAAWKTLIEQHHAAGHIRPSSSEFTSPSFIIPKADMTILPHWVNNYHALNSVTIPDHYPLPQVDDILADCAKGKIWGIIDMMNSFFQTLVKPEHIKYTATVTDCLILFTYSLGLLVLNSLLT